jgi:hypothetical protein
VSAIQAHDITRQQSEHVEEAFAIISARIRDAENSKNGSVQDFPEAYAGLIIQIYQLKSIKVTVESWTMQIKTCMDGILRVSASEMVGIGPVVLGQERDVASRLAHIELLVACRRVTITRLLASELLWLPAMKSCSPDNSIST